MKLIDKVYSLQANELSGFGYRPVPENELFCYFKLFLSDGTEQEEVVHRSTAKYLFNLLDTLGF